MTVAKAKVVFATHMQAARTRKLTTYERNQLSEARQVLRTSRKPAMNPRTRFFRTKAEAEKHRKALIRHHVYADLPEYDSRKDMYTLSVPKASEIKAKSNPKQPGVLIYEHVDCIYATKGPGHLCDAECAKNGHRYFHEFKSRPKMYGLKDGSILIKK